MSKTRQDNPVEESSILQLHGFHETYKMKMNVTRNTNEDLIQSGWRRCSYCAS